MRAAVIDRFGGPEALTVRSVAEPVPGEGEIVMRVDACGVNPHDAWVRDGKRLGVDFPRILGVEPAGTVARLGPGVAGPPVGTRIVVHPHFVCGTCAMCRRGAPSACSSAVMLGQHRDGGYAEYVVLPAGSVLLTPDSLDRISAASVAVTHVTAWHALITRGRLQPGETVVVSGATGGLGLAAIQIARLAGARVIATTSRGADSVLAEMGADVVFDRTRTDLVANIRRETAGLGADLWLDHAGGDGFSAAVDALAPRGRLVNCGAGAGDAVTFDVRRLYPAEREIIGAIIGSIDEQQTVLRLLGSGHLRAVVADVFPLDEVAAAHRALAAGGHIGKIVLDLTR